MKPTQLSPKNPLVAVGRGGKKIRLLFVITKLELGGAQTQLLSLVRHLDKSLYDLFLFTASTGELMEEALSIPHVSVYRSKWLERPIHPVKDFFALRELTLFIKKNRIDLVHTHSSKAGILGRWAARQAGVRGIFHTVHGWSFNDFQAIYLRQFYMGLERMTAKMTDRIIVVSGHDKRKGLALRIGDKSRYMIIPYGIERAAFGLGDRSLRGELGIDDETFLVGTVACFKPQKAPEDFIKLAVLISRNIPRAKFLMVGDGVLKNKIERLILKTGLKSKVILTGWRRDIPKILSAMDLFVLTSLWEGLPIAVLEAMKSRIPVLATDTGGISEVISDGETGFLAACHDVPSMLEKALAIFRDPLLRGRIVSAGERRVNENFETSAMVASHAGLYEGAIKNEERRR
ncbi:MAG: putative glycosyltransferase EpsD [Candidatus Omnitrophica bacterium ADurb.Bin277]|nr:MAG: putative glycosyltransferase EpsD [Candidatus Omnitrophica bacterium ADurb.Bin277]